MVKVLAAITVGLLGGVVIFLVTWTLAGVVVYGLPTLLAMTKAPTWLIWVSGGVTVLALSAAAGAFIIKT